MTIKAKYAGKCSACGGAISIGDSIEWERGKGARHSECPKAGTILNAAYQPKGRTGRTNGKAADCTFCGAHLAAGEGNLWWGEDGCCNDPRHFDDGGWHVTCFDRDACSARVVERREAAKAKADALRAAQEAARAPLVLGVAYSADTVVDDLPTGCKPLWTAYPSIGAWYVDSASTIYYVYEFDGQRATWRTTATIEQIDAAKAAGLRPSLY